MAVPEADALSAQAVAKFEAGYSCAQAVLATCGARLGLSEAEAIKLGAGLGAGLGGLRETCGAVTAMAAIIGLRKAPPEPMDAQEKAKLYREVQRAVADFDEAFGSHTCLELLKRASIRKQAGDAPEARTAEYYASRPCSAFVRFCAERAMRD